MVSHLTGKSGFGALILVALASAALAQDRTGCLHPDLSFREFLAHFRSDSNFQISRVNLPLRYGERGPDNYSSARSLSMSELKDRQNGLVVKDPAASNTGDRETDTCEDRPQVGRRVATLVQYSCHSDLFSNKYRFVRRQGCWFLTDMMSRGG
jgi:hypothetical protein